ncbi:MAG: protocatechuate 3,4-dioxygenase [Novosphingobium sp.]|nr:protocatechuate 3,4-dioxygenase [Novosphingobium sp.]
MEPQIHLLSRRAFAGSALATAALVAAKGVQAASKLSPTPSQTEGPFYPHQRLAEEDADLTWIKGHKRRAQGKVIQVTGRVFDRYGNPVRGARVELWQCNSLGRYAHPGDIATVPLDPDFQGYAAIRTGRKGEWRITTIKPAAYDSPIGRRTPHIHFTVHGNSGKLTTQMYFSDDEATNLKDGLYKNLGGEAARTVARLGAANQYDWDIVLRS